MCPPADEDPPTEATIGRIFRSEYGRCVAALISIFGDIDIAEDSVQEAFATALHKWPTAGVPPNPGGWITTTARNRAIDRLRRETRGRALLDDAVLAYANDSPTEVDLLRDDRLRLFFTCCHPALSTEAQIGLTLKLLGGLSTAEVARLFLVASRPWPSALSAPNARSRQPTYRTGFPRIMNSRNGLAPSSPPCT